VTGDPTFEVTFYERAETSALNDAAGDHTANGVAPVDGVLSLACTVGTNCHVAPLNVHTIEVQHAADLCGGACKKPRLQFTIRGAPTGFFVDTDTGEVLGSPLASTAGGRPTLITLWVVDESGFNTFVETIAITVVAPATFTVKTLSSGERTETSGAYTDPTAMLGGEGYTWLLGDLYGVVAPASEAGLDLERYDGESARAAHRQFASTCYHTIADGCTVQLVAGFQTLLLNDVTHEHRYRIAPLKFDNATVVSKGTVDEITYTLIGAPTDWFVSADTGVIFGRFLIAGAVLGFGQNFTVEECCWNSRLLLGLKSSMHVTSSV
jgi:hypothetical protein